MRKVTLTAFVLAVLLLARGTPHDAVVAQNAPKATGGVIEISEGKDGKFRFFVRDEEKKLLAMSGPGGFESAGDAAQSIQRLKEVLKTAKVTTLKKKSKAAQ
jgi:hypothetical protein